MRYFVILTLAATLSACGVDGEPTPPEPKASAKPGISVGLSGRAEIGIAKSNKPPA